MSHLPLRPSLKSYTGCKESLRRQNAERNATARRIVDHLNRLIANNPDEIQQYIFAYVASDLEVSVDEVRSAVPLGGYNGITLAVSSADRRALEPYKRKTPDEATAGQNAKSPPMG